MYRKYLQELAQLKKMLYLYRVSVCLNAMTICIFHRTYQKTFNFVVCYKEYQTDEVGGDDHLLGVTLGRAILFYNMIYQNK